MVRNLRDLIPKQVFNFLLIKCIRELEFEAFQFTSDVDKLKEWLNEVKMGVCSPAMCVSAEQNASRPLRSLTSLKNALEWIQIFPSLSEPVRRSLNM